MMRKLAHADLILSIFAVESRAYPYEIRVFHCAYESARAVETAVRKALGSAEHTRPGKTGSHARSKEDDAYRVRPTAECRNVWCPELDNKASGSLEFSTTTRNPER